MVWCTLGFSPKLCSFHYPCKVSMQPQGMQGCQKKGLIQEFFHLIKMPYLRFTYINKRAAKFSHFLFHYIKGKWYSLKSKNYIQDLETWKELGSKAPLCGGGTSSYSSWEESFSLKEIVMMIKYSTVQCSHCYGVNVTFATIQRHVWMINYDYLIYSPQVHGED